MKYFSKLIVLIVPFLSFSQQKDLQLAEIMKGNEFIGQQPENVHWSADGKQILFDWNPNNQLVSTEYAYSIGSKKTDSLSLEKAAWEAIYTDKKQFSFADYIYAKGTYLLSLNKKTSEITTFIQWSKSLQNIVRSTDGKTVFFQSGTDFYAFDINTGHLHYLTSCESSKKEAETAPTYLERQQEELFAYIRHEKALDKAKSEKSTSLALPSPAKIELADKLFDHAVISPTGNSIAVVVAKKTTPKNPVFAKFVTEDGYVQTEETYPKVGAPVDEQFLLLYLTEKDTTLAIDFSKLPGLWKRPDFYKDYGINSDSLDAAKTCYILGPTYSQDGKNCVVELKSFDNKDRWIVLLNTTNGKTTLIDHQHDEAWIGGPGISMWNMEAGNIGWFSDNKQVYFQSEKTGYSHLYIYDLVAQKTTQLTEGKFEIYNAELSHDSRTFFITANKNHPGNREFYKFDIANKTWIPIFVKDGNAEVQISPDEQKIAVRYSYKNKPWEVYLGENKENTTLTQLTESQSEQFKKHDWIVPEVIEIPTVDGLTSYARLYLPKAEKKNGAAILFVHGAGYLQNAHNWWSDYYHEYLFHNLLVELGYTVLDIDYRASEGYGRDHRTSIYRHMGGADLDDQLFGKKLLVEKYGVDVGRVGIYGGSYGGFITLMALLTKPGEFKCGAAIRSVTDWAHYNHPYTANILNTPETDSLAYRKSSPIYFADNLKDNLLMLHGMVDNNVSFQDIVRLSQRFIELGKTNWSLAPYPVESHGFLQSSSWTDEYGRILKLFNDNLLKNEQ